jgi:hypothetical protein
VRLCNTINFYNQKIAEPEKPKFYHRALHIASLIVLLYSDDLHHFLLNTMLACIPSLYLRDALYKLGQDTLKVIE